MLSLEIGQCSTGNLCSYSHNRASRNQCDQGRQGQSFLPATRAQEQTDGKIPSRGSGRRGESPSGTSGRIPCDISLGESVRIRHVIVATHPFVPISSLNQDAQRQSRFRHAEIDGQPSEVSMNCVKCQVGLLKESTQFRCVFHDSHPSKFIQRKNIGIKSHSQIFPNVMTTVREERTPDETLPQCPQNSIGLGKTFSQVP